MRFWLSLSDHLLGTHYYFVTFSPEKRNTYYTV